MATAVKTRVSEEEYLATMTGETPSLEFVNGEVFQKPMTKRDHNEVRKRLARLLFQLEDQHGGSFAWEATTDLSAGADRRYRVPDLAYWAAGRPLARPDDVYLPPTLAIEVRSRGQPVAELREKCREYRARGVDLCWLIDPEARTVEVFDDAHDGAVLGEGALLESSLLPGFSLPVSELWAELA
jgi:Uma2 family endonuclease